MPDSFIADETREEDSFEPDNEVQYAQKETKQNQILSEPAKEGQFFQFFLLLRSTLP